MNYYYGNFKMDGEIKYSRQKVVDLALSWVGKNEKDGSYKEIIDIYNNFYKTNKTEKEFVVKYYFYHSYSCI